MSGSDSALEQSYESIDDENKENDPQSTQRGVSNITGKGLIRGVSTQRGVSNIAGKGLLRGVSTQRGVSNIAGKGLLRGCPLRGV